MAAELYRHTNKPDRVNLFHPELRNCHLPSENSKRPRRTPLPQPAPPTPVTNIWENDEWALADATEMEEMGDINYEDGEELLAAAGF